MAAFEVKEFLHLAKTYPIIDVRSPSEHLNGHIPGAHNIPLFNDAERAVIGSSYKVDGKNEAILEGLEIVGPKLASFVQKATEIAFNDKVLVHCWRGGMRSGSFSWLLNTAGIKSHTLKGGYKAYRNFALEFFSAIDNLILLGGETGSGKTELLAKLKKSGEQIIDLESLAQHKGSSFGGLSGLNQPTNEQFQNDLLKDLMQKDLKRRIWVEDESHNIGGIRIPDVFWFKMRSAPVIRLLFSKQERITRLVQDYAKHDKELLLNGILRINKKLGGLQTARAIDFLEQNNFKEVADICLDYYDKAYKTGLHNRSYDLVHNLNVKEGSVNIDLIKNIIELADEILYKKKHSLKN